MNQPKTFDQNLTPDQRRRAEILRKSFRPQPQYVRPDPPASGKLERFDDCFGGNPSLLGRSIELRKRAKAELYWDNATTEEKTAIRDAVVAGEPFRNNEDYTRHFMRRKLNDIISSEVVLNHIIFQVLAL